MQKPSRLPIDGHVIDHNIKDFPKLYTCYYCGEPTPNYSRCTLTKVMDDIHWCDECYNAWKACQPFD